MWRLFAVALVGIVGCEIEKIKQIQLQMLEVFTKEQYGTSLCTEKAQNMFNKFFIDDAIVTSVLNSGKGLNDLGDFEACNTSPHSRYILIEILGLPARVGFGLCGPRECAELDYSPLKLPMAELLNQVMGGGGSPLSANLSEESILFIDPEQRTAEYPFYSPLFFVAMGFFTLVIIVSILGSWQGTSIDPYSLPQKIISCFNFVKNLQTIFGPLGKEEPELRVFNGIRVMGMVWVILGHTFFYSTDGFINNVFEFNQFLTIVLDEFKYKNK